MAVLQYLVEYVFADTVPGETSAFVHLRLDLPAYVARIDKEDYYSDVAVDDSVDEIVPSNGGSTTQTFTLYFPTVYPSTLVGTFFKRLGGSPDPNTDTQIQTFTTDGTGVLDFTDIGSPTTKASSGTFNVTTSRITVVFNLSPADPYYFEVTYNYSSGSGGVDSFVSGIFDIPGIVELAMQANRLWIMKSPAYSWPEVMPHVIEYLRVNLAQDTVEELAGSGAVISSEDQRRAL